MCKLNQPVSCVKQLDYHKIRALLEDVILRDHGTMKLCPHNIHPNSLI